MNYTEKLLGHLRGHYFPGKWDCLSGEQNAVERTFLECLDAQVLELIAERLHEERVILWRMSGKTTIRYTFPGLDDLLEESVTLEGQERFVTFLKQYLEPEKAEDMTVRIYADMCALNEGRERERQFWARESELESRPWPGGYKGIL